MFDCIASYISYSEQKKKKLAMGLFIIPQIAYEPGFSIYYNMVCAHSEDGAACASVQSDQSLRMTYND